MADKVIITIEVERNLNGTVARKTNLEGEGFHYFELIGLLQITSYEFAQQSLKTAIEMPKNKKVKLKFSDDGK